MSSLITYLLIGIGWDVMLNFIMTITEGNKFTFQERMYSLLLWPISFCIFAYHFIKTFIE